jgi:hypothetical protein
MAHRAGIDQYLNDGCAQCAGTAGHYYMAAGKIEVEHFAISFM